VIFFFSFLSTRLEGWDIANSGNEAITMYRAHIYPPTTLEMSGKSRAIGAHTDFGALTLLLQDTSMFPSHSPRCRASLLILEY